MKKSTGKGIALVITIILFPIVIAGYSIYYLCKFIKRKIEDRGLGGKKVRRRKHLYYPKISKQPQKCNYCNSELDFTTTKCPYCGSSI